MYKIIAWPLTLLVSSGAYASTSVTVSTLYSGAGKGGTENVTISAAEGTRAGVQNAGTEQATASAFASNGILKVSGSSSSTSNPTTWIAFLGASASSNASWQDLQTYTVSTAPLGAILQVVSRVLIVGTLGTDFSGEGLGGVNAQYSSNASWNFSASFNGLSQFTGSGSEQYFQDSGRNVTQLINGQSVGVLGSFLVNFSTINGSSLTTSFAVSAKSSARTYSQQNLITSTSNYSFGNSIYWDGVQSVSYNGAPSSYVVQSLSGVDYSKSFAPLAAAVPEPATYAMMLVGIFGLCVTQRRKRSKGTCNRLEA